MGYVSNRTRGYNQGFHDSFLNHLRAYKLAKAYSVFAWFAAKGGTPEEEYAKGYEEGFAHGGTARAEYIAHAGTAPTARSDFEWLNNERQAQTLRAYFDEAAPPPAIDLYRQKYSDFMRLIEERRLGTVLKESRKFFYQARNASAFHACIRLHDRLQANRQSARNHESWLEDRHAEFGRILNAIGELIDSELRTLIDATDLHVGSPAVHANTQSSDSRAVANATDFALAHRAEIDHVIIENWLVPRTQAPGRYAETFNRVVQWFDNFTIDEYKNALLVLQGVRYISDHQIDSMLEKMCHEIRRLFASDLPRVCLFGLGNDPSSSGSQFLYSIRQKLALTGINFPTEYQNLPPNAKAVVFIDDIIGSGRQATRFSRDYLSQMTVDKYFYSLIAFEDGIEHVTAEAGFKGVFTTRVLPESERAFSGTSAMFGTAETRASVRSMATKYGATLYPKGPLGYDDGQALIVFAHNTPNNTLPIVWASENNEKTIGVPWSPLWERRKQSVHS